MATTTMRMMMMMMPSVHSNNNHPPVMGIVGRSSYSAAASIITEATPDSALPGTTMAIV